MIFSHTKEEAYEAIKYLNNKIKEVAKMDEVTKKAIPQQGSQKSRCKGGLEKDPGTSKTDFKKHWNQNTKNNH